MTSHLLGAPVTPPPLVPPAINLVRSSRKPSDPAGTRWMSGITYTPTLNFEAVGYSQCGTSSTMPTGVNHSVGGLHDGIVWMPIVQVVSKQCSTIGWEATDWRQQLTDLMAASLPKFVETEFWTGKIAQAEGLDQLWLASSHATDVTPGGAAVTRTRGFEALEEALGDSGVGAQGMIHARRGSIGNYTHVRREGNLLLTVHDTIVVAGVGYKGTDPTGAAASAGTEWIYATGLTDIRIDPNITFIPDVTGQPGEIDRATNTGILRAEREVLVSWDGLQHFACHVTLDT